MGDILESLGNNSQLGKVLCELFGQIATSSLLKTNDNDNNGIAKVKGETSPVCKSVPVSQSNGVRPLQKSVSENENESGKFETTNNAVVASSLARPRYQWHEPETGPRRTTDLKQLYSVYVGHIPKDITEGELSDLFSDIGEVADSFVFPPTGAHTYTYGFVRFHTLDEAKDAVKERNLKVIGSHQINVELSSSTRRRLQTNPDDEDNSPLLRKDYPKVPRQTLSDNDEKQVIGKIKASLRRLHNNMSSFGNDNPEEVFENIKTILKMLINYPIALADPSADRGEEKLGNASTDSESKRQALAQDSSTDMQSWRHSSGEVASQQASMTHCRTSSRLPSFALEAAKSSGANMDKPFDSGNELPCSAIPRTPFIQENNSSTSERMNSNLINKVREFLDSSSGEDNVLSSSSKRSKNNTPDSKYSLSSSSTDDEQYTRTKIDVKPRSPDLPSLLNTAAPLDASKHQPVRSESNTYETIACSQFENNDDFSAQQCSETPNARDSSNYNAPMRPVSCAEHSGWVNNASSSHDSSDDDHGMCHALLELPNLSEEKHSAVTEKQNFEGVLVKHEDTVNQSCSRSNTWVLKNTEQVAHSSSSVVNAMSEYIPQYSSEDQRSSKSTSKASEARSLSPNTSDRELTDALAKETLFHECKDDRTQIHDVWNKQEHTLNNDSTRIVGNSYSQNKTSNLRRFNDIPQPISNTRDMTLYTKPPSQEMEKIKSADAKQSVLTASNETFINQHPLSSMSKNSQLNERLINVDGGEKHVPSELDIDDRRAEQQTFYLEDMKTVNSRQCLSLSINQGLPQQPSTCGSFNESLHYNKKLFDVSRQKKPNPPEYDIQPKFSEQQDCLSNKLIQTSLGNPWLNEKAASNECYNLLSQPDNNLKLSDAKVQSTPLQEPLDQRDLFSNHFNQIAKGNSQIVDHSPRHISTKNIETRALSKCNESHSSVPTMKSQGDLSIHDEDTAIDSDSLAVSQNGELDPQAKNTDFSPSVQLFFHSFRTNNGPDVANTMPRGSVLTSGNGSKFSRRRALAPSFSFSAPKKDHKDTNKTETRFIHDSPNQTLKTPIRNFPSTKTQKFQSKKTADVMANDSAIVSISKNDSGNPTFDMSEFDFGFDDDSSSSPLVESSEPSKSPSCPSDDAETIKLKDQMKEHVLKLEELQQILNKCPQRRRERLPHLFDVHTHGLELETRIHDAEILLQKKEEMWKARSNERELAYEKEIFHSADDNQILGEFSQEMRKEYVRNEIVVAQLKCKILELKIEQSRCEEIA